MKAIKFKMQEEMTFQFKSRCREKRKSSILKAIRTNYFSLEEGRSFDIVRPSSDWMKPTHIREDNLLYTVV